MSKTQNSYLNAHFLPSISYKNFIILAFVITVIYALSHTLMRLALAFDTFDEWQNDFGKMFLMGFRLDMRVVCSVAGFILLLGYLTSAIRSLSLSLSLSRCERVSA